MHVEIWSLYLCTSDPFFSYTCVLIIFVCYRINSIMEEENTIFSCENMVAAMKA